MGLQGCSSINTYTIRSSAVVDYIDTNMDRSKVAMAFVYCEYSNPISRSEVDILSSIIQQLVQQCAHMPSEIRAFRDRYAGRVSRPTVEERIGLIRLLAQLFDRTYILIDALVGVALGLLCFQDLAS